MLEYKKIPFNQWESMYLDDDDFDYGSFDIPLEEKALWYYCDQCHNQMVVYYPINLCQNCNPNITIPAWSELRN